MPPIGGGGIGKWFGWNRIVLGILPISVFVNASVRTEILKLYFKELE